GSIHVLVTGGTGEIQYAISPNLNQFSAVNTFTNLAAGTYQVIAQDANGCFETFEFEITQPDPITATAINVEHEVCYQSGDGSFEIQVVGGTAPYWTALDSNVDTAFVEGRFAFSDLSTGTHVVFVRDAEGCETTVFVEIEPGVDLSAKVTPIYECTGNIPGNYLDVVLDDPGMAADVMYALDSTDPASMKLVPEYSNLAPGEHYISVMHANGCMATYSFTIEAYEPLVLSLENNSLNQITAVATGGVEAYTYFFGETDHGTNNTFYINRTGTYTVRVVDQNGCEALAEIYLEFIDIGMPNFFTPDGDGLNDTWIPDNLQ